MIDFCTVLVLHFELKKAIRYKFNDFKLSYHHNPSCCCSRCIQNDKCSKNYQPDYDSFVHNLHYPQDIHQYLNNISLLLKFTVQI